MDRSPWDPTDFVFLPEAVLRIEAIATKVDTLEYALQHIRNMYDEVDFLSRSQFSTPTAYCLASYVISQIFTLSSQYIIDEYTVLHKIYNLLHEIVRQILYIVRPVDSVKYMIEAYPLHIVTNICDSEYIDSYVIGECIRNIIKIKKVFPRWIPTGINEFLTEEVPLSGHEKSPLSELELQALLDYLGTNRKLFVRLWLQITFELTMHKRFNAEEDLSLALQTLLNSKWLYVLCLIKEEH